MDTLKAKKKLKNMKNCRLKPDIYFRLRTENSDDYYEKYIKMKYNLDDELPLNKAIEIPTMTIVVRAIFLENKKYHPQVFSDECL